MADQVFIFGSFTEDEASVAQRGSSVRGPQSPPGSPSGSPAGSPGGRRLQGQVQWEKGGRGLGPTNHKSSEEASLQQSRSSRQSQKAFGVRQLLVETVTETAGHSPSRGGQARGTAIERGAEGRVGQASVARTPEFLSLSESTGGGGKVEVQASDLVVAGASEPNTVDLLTMNREAPFDAKALLKSLREGSVLRIQLQPRGLWNTGNSCFLNSVLQALLSCSPFLSLVQRLQVHHPPQKICPTLRAFAEFGLQFRNKPINGRPTGAADPVSSAAVDVGHPFAPAMFDMVLHNFRRENSGMRNRQEDAQEFLSFLMYQMHDEMLHLEGKDVSTQQAPTPDCVNEDDSWETVGRKNRSAIVRTHAFEESSITAVFGGKLRSVVKTAGKKPSATVQPFLLLHLDVLLEAVRSVDDALKSYVAPVPIEGYKAKSGDAPAVSASKSVQIQSLPKVLVLHLTRFSFGPSGARKLHKPIRFSLLMTIGLDLLSSSVGPGLEGREYELVATISHHGKDPSGGHYTTDSRQLDGRWLRFDDRTVSCVGPKDVLHDQAYLLFYRQILKS